MRPSPAFRGPAVAVATVAAAGAVAGCGEKEVPPPPESGARDLYQQAFDAFGSDRPWSGLWYLTRVLHVDPAHPGALSGLGVHAYRQGRYDDVPAYLEPLARVRPLVRDEALALADACLRLNRFAQAESLFAALDERGPPDAGVLVALGTARRSRGDLEAAAADFRRALAIDPTGEDACFALADVLLDANRADEAWRILESAPEGADPSARRHLLRARVLLQWARGQEIGGDFRGPAAGTTRKALNELEACLAAEPANVDALHLLGQARRRLGDLEGAREAARRHRDALSALARPGPAHAVQALVQGGIALEDGDEEAALAAWERGLEDDPENPYLHCVLAPLYRKLGRREEARASFTVLRRAMNGAVPGPLFLATGKELRRRGLPAVAIGQFEIAVNRMPESGEAAYFLALARAESGDWNAAVAAAAPLE